MLQKVPTGEAGVEWAALNSECPAGSSGPGYRTCVSSDFESEAEALKLARRGLVRQLTNDLDLNRKSQEKGVQRLPDIVNF